MADTHDERTIEPTPLRRERAQAEGRVPRSADLNSAGLLLGGLLILVLSGGALVRHLTELMTSSLGGQSWRSLLRPSGELDSGLVASHWSALVTELAEVLLPPLALATLLVVAINVVQTGFLFLPRKLAPDWSRVNPMAGLARLFSAGNGARLSFGVLKLAVIVSVAVGSVYRRADQILAIGSYDSAQGAALAWEVCLWTCVKIGTALVALAVVDYLFARWKHERELRMTPAELREEMRSMQGDPQVSARRRALARKAVSETAPVSRV
jgi:flagellar biosynthetic protein FlhB